MCSCRYVGSVNLVQFSHATWCDVVLVCITPLQSARNVQKVLICTHANIQTGNGTGIMVLFPTRPELFHIFTVDEV